jgi:hypothetical protein
LPQRLGHLTIAEQVNLIRSIPHLKTHHMKQILLVVAVMLLAASSATDAAPAAELRAGVARVDITDRAFGPVHDPLFARALVLKNEGTTVVLITIDAVAIGEIGH